VLYSYWRSSSSWRVRLALSVKGIPYSYSAVNLLKHEQLAEGFGVKHSMNQVPWLEVDGHGIGESLAIIEYLEETHPAPALLPTDPMLRAKVRQLAQIICADIQPLQNLRVLVKIEAKLGNDERQAWGRHWINNGLSALEHEVKQTAGKYCVGDSLSIADICLVPQLYNSRRFNVDLSPYPTLLRIEAALESLPVFIAAHPDQCPDAVITPAPPPTITAASPAKTA